jgi:septum formation protein
VTELILASKSPRRRELIPLLGHPFKCLTSQVEELPLPGETPAEHVVRLSELKVREAGDRVGEGIVIGADTVVVLDGEIIGKPVSAAEAREMLGRLQGRIHTVYTGFALYDVTRGRLRSGFETTDVAMIPMTPDLIRRYVETGEPLDKAGAYGIQGYGAVLISSIRGCYFNVMGLPLSRLMEALNEFTDGAWGYFGRNAESRT